MRTGRIGNARSRILLLCLAVLQAPAASAGATAQTGPGGLMDEHRRQAPTSRGASGRTETRRNGPKVLLPNRRSPMPMSDPNIEQAIALMDGFAARTGLASDLPARRYLWTDAFAVCNFLGLAHATGEHVYTGLALRLVDRVHHTLGRHRDDDSRSGWISGLGEREGRAHPTRGGLRIGKALPERGPDEPYDQHLEWQRDGQYFHYLTKWMHALDQVSRATGEPNFNTWARELAATAHSGFSYLPAANRPPRMYWKMSIDLSRALVPSMGQHDPLDGYLTIMHLRATASGFPHPPSRPDLEQPASEFAAMLRGAELVSPDPLGIGGLLVDAYRAQQLMRLGVLSDDALLERLLKAALAGLQAYAASGELQAPAGQRLAFRELGLAIGLHAAQRMRPSAVQGRTDLSPKAQALLGALLRYVPLGDDIEGFWRQSEHQRADTWIEHRDINEVMLATRLVPEGFLGIMPAD
jgi:hypothetical protein